jgi:hypothetical protein
MGCNKRFGEILPSAIFTGPKKLELASKMVRLFGRMLLRVFVRT